MKYRLIEEVTFPNHMLQAEEVIPSGTIINLEPVEEVKVKAFVPEKGENFFFLDDGLEISSAREGYCSELFIQGNLKFRTKKDAQIAQAKVIELFNSFK